MTTTEQVKRSAAAAKARAYEEEIHGGEEIKAVAAVERAFSILEAFGTEDITLSLAQLAERTGLIKSTILRLLFTLERHGYIMRNESGNYHVGPAPLRLGRLFQRAVSHQDVILPTLKKLSQQTGESASYHVRLNNQRLYLYRVDSNKIVRDHYKPGDLLPLDRGAGGIMLTAFANPDDPVFAREREELVVAVTGSLSVDMAGVAAPVFDDGDQVAGVLTVSGPASRFDDASVKSHVLLLFDAAAKVTAAMGGDTHRFEQARQAAQKRTYSINRKGTSKRGGSK